MTVENGWGRDVFSFALAVQNILWGIGQPFAGAIADRFGTVRVLCCGAMLYAIGLVIMAYSTTPLMLDLGAGVFIGFGLAGCSFAIVLAAFGKLLPERTRPMAFGIGTAAGSSSDTEIESLLSYVGELNNVSFIRNGDPHTAKEAEAHLRLKWTNLKSRIATAEDFILYCGTKSSLSGKPYIIRFSDGHEEPAAQVLSSRLQLIRAKATR